MYFADTPCDSCRFEVVLLRNFPSTDPLSWSLQHVLLKIFIYSEEFCIRNNFRIKLKEHLGSCVGLQAGGVSKMPCEGYKKSSFINDQINARREY